MMETTPRNGDSSGRTTQFSRRIARHQLPAYLNVYNRHTGRFIGSMGNVSCNGFMLMSSLPMQLNAIYDMQLYLPATTEEVPQTLTFSALSRWCRPDLTPGHYDVGFSSLDDSPVFSHLADTLRDYFTFIHPMDA